MAQIQSTPAEALAATLTTTPLLFPLQTDTVNSTIRRNELKPSLCVARLNNADSVPRTAVFMSGNMPNAGGEVLTVTVPAGEIVYVGGFERARFLYLDSGVENLRIKAGEAQTTSTLSVEMVQIHPVTVQASISTFNAD